MCEGVSYVIGRKFHSKTTQQPQGYGNNQHTKTYHLFLNGSPTNVNCLYNYVFPKKLFIYEQKRFCDNNNNDNKHKII